VRIALVNVQYHEGNNVFPPLGLLYVAGALREAGHELRVLDGDPTRRDLTSSVVDFRPELIGLSFLTMTFDRARDLAAELKRRLPEALLLGGGAHATVDPEGTLADTVLDAVAVGEGERTAVELAAALASGAPLERVAGVVTRAGRGPERETVEDLDSLPFPARDLLGHAPYLRPPGLIRGWASSGIASMLASRGCPFRCSYCGSHRQLGRDVRIRSVDDVLAELDLLVQRDGIRGMYWVDDVFTHDRAWTLAFCEALARRPYRLRWGCQSRVSAVDEQLLRAMRRAGCVQIDFGVESGSKEVLRSMHKGIEPMQVEEAFSLTRRLGLRTGASFILGSPGESEQDIEATAALADRIRPDWTVFFYSTPYPGTDLWKKERHSPQAAAWPAYGEQWNNRVSRDPFPGSHLPGPDLVAWRSRLQNRHFRRNYMRARNLPFILRLARTLPRPEVRGAIAQAALGSGRLDDVVEAAFASWRGE